MNRRPCGCCGTCGWDCEIPTSICLTIDVCGQTIVVNPAELQFGIPPNQIYFVEHCYWYHYEPLTFDDEYSTQYDCTYDGRSDPDVGNEFLCPLDPESPSGYANRTRCRLDSHVQARCVRTGYVEVQISLSPTGSQLTISIKVYLQATIYIREWGTAYTYTDTTCPSTTPTWVLTNTETFDVETEVFLPNDGVAVWNYQGLYTPECINLLDEYLVEVYSYFPELTIGQNLLGHMGFSKFCTYAHFGYTWAFNAPCITPGYDFGNLGCGLGVAYVTLANLPCP